MDESSCFSTDYNLKRDQTHRLNFLKEVRQTIKDFYDTHEDGPMEFVEKI